MLRYLYNDYLKHEKGMLKRDNRKWMIFVYDRTEKSDSCIVATHKTLVSAVKDR